MFNIFCFKDCDQTRLLQTHITGVLAHGKSTHAMIDMNQWPHDSNLTINCLLETLLEEASDGQLTPILYVQLDNCGRENKNKFFIGIMALMVVLGLVKEVTMSFLMVGHTHEGKFAKV